MFRNMPHRFRFRGGSLNGIETLPQLNTDDLATVKREHEEADAEKEA